MKIAVITAIYGGCDTLKEWVRQDIPCDFYCFSDTVFQPEKSMWKVIREPYHLNSEYALTPAFAKSNIRAKYYRMQGHKIPMLANHDCLLWVDASMRGGNPVFVSDMVNYAGEMFALYTHPSRECAYAEAVFSAGIPKYKTEPLIDQIAAYRAAGLPENYGLWATGVIPRTVNPLTNKIFDDWFSECVSWSIQDQVSLPYVLWKNGMTPNNIPGNIYFNDYHRRKNHCPGYEELGKK